MLGRGKQLAHGYNSVPEHWPGLGIKRRHSAHDSCLWRVNIGTSRLEKVLTSEEVSVVTNFHWHVHGDVRLPDYA